MNTWIAKNNKKEETINLQDYERVQETTNGDIILVYTDNVSNGTFQIYAKYIKRDDDIVKEDNFTEITTDLPYKILYLCKNGKYLYKLSEKELNFLIPLNLQTTPLSQNIGNSNPVLFKSFLQKIEPNENARLNTENISNNIEFIIGQPNTGKSYSFEETRLFDSRYKNHYRYLKIPVSGGIGNEYKGLQNTDLAITFDLIKKELRFGEFLQILMSAIVNPRIPHVVFLDDFHNQDISSLLSEYTPLFKSQQRRKLSDLGNDDIFQETFESTEVFINTWNNFIDTHCQKDIDGNDIPKVALTNRISGNSLMLVFPENFYLLGAANFNENSLNIFADWEDRANITYKHPITSFDSSELQGHDDSFLNCCITLNKNLKKILEEKNIFESERYCFGMWKIVDTENKLITDVDIQRKIIKFFFGTIKNSLRLNNKNSLVNEIGWELLQSIRTDSWFASHMNSIGANEQIDYKVLHDFNIYENDI